MLNDDLTNSRKTGHKGTFQNKIRKFDILGFPDQDKVTQGPGLNHTLKHDQQQYYVLQEMQFQKPSLL